MTKALVIVESPAKAKTIEKFLEKGFVVKASGGHVRDLPTYRLGVKVSEGFEPTYTPLKEKKKIIENLKKTAQKKDIVYLAPDPDREGEAIAWHLAEVLELDPQKVRRIEFNEITKGAVLSALEKPREINMASVDAQQARRVLDRLVGYKLSPLLWKKIKKGLSAGRVQSVAVWLICEREEAISKFVPVEYWTVDADLLAKKKKFKASVVKKGNKKLVINNEDEATAVVNGVKGQKFIVDSVDFKVKKRYPAPPFITSTLQQEASRKLGWSAKKTMMVAQKLYEGLDIDGEHMGLITYMRTDSIRISDDARNAGHEMIKEAYGKEFVGKGVFTKGKKKSKIQDAHEAVRPTDVTKKPEDVKTYLSSDELKLYDLIWKRFVAALMSPADIAVTTVNIGVGEYTFRATGSIVKFQGFMTVYTEGKDDDDSEEIEGLLPEMEKGMEIDLKEIIPLQHFTKPPARYTDATLVKTLEEKGIGRPSTYAPIISTIVDRGYINKEKKRLVPTELGTVVNSQLKDHFSAIIDVDFTAKMEAKLDEIMEGNLNWKKVLDEFYSPFEEELKLAEKNMPKVKSDGKVTDEVCDKCGSPMLEKESRYGSFLACSGFPKCRNTKPIVNDLDIGCPKCDGQLTEKRTKRGKVFYGCNNYPKCDFAVWEKPLTQKCKSCDGLLLLQRSKKVKCNECGEVTDQGDYEES